MDIKIVVINSFASLQEAFPARITQSRNLGEYHSKISKMWIELLAYNLNLLAGGDSISFHKGNSNNQKIFKLNEYLHDILICILEVIKSPKQKKTLHYIKRVLWQVESELDDKRDSRGLLMDFNKLTLGSAPNKLFVFSNKQYDDNKSLLDFFSIPASYCSGNLYIAIIPHPKDLHNPEISTEVYKYSESWKLLN